MENLKLHGLSPVLHVADGNFNNAVVVDIKNWYKKEEGPIVSKQTIKPWEQALKKPAGGYLRPKKHDFF